jgi:hypothetical protein
MAVIAGCARRPEERRALRVQTEIIARQARDTRPIRCVGWALPTNADHIDNILRKHHRSIVERAGVRNMAYIVDGGGQCPPLGFGHFFNTGQTRPDRGRDYNRCRYRNRNRNRRTKDGIWTQETGYTVREDQPQYTV